MANASEVAANALGEASSFRTQSTMGGGKHLEWGGGSTKRILLPVVGHEVPQ